MRHRHGLSSARALEGRVKPLVIALHGYMGNRLQLVPMSTVLASRGFDVLNFSYPSRAYPLAHHAKSLADAVAHRAEIQERKSKSTPAVHFVTHSFGGVVLSAALAEPAMKHIDVGRAALIAPPARGCQFASIMFKGQGELQKLPNSVRAAVVAAAGVFLGKGSGKEIATMDESWFARRLGALEDTFSDGNALVIAGNLGGLNPLVDGPSDGVVRVAETMLGCPHQRLEESLTHNTLVYSPTLLSQTADFLEGKEVGYESRGVPWKKDEPPLLGFSPTAG